ncbi:MAG: hypothetical protein MRJ65_10825 [Candidatus Brocadiaceae bacterium]|nr:hypothetical protein [Candidatus Brocadiaceae bacterium]
MKRKRITDNKHPVIILGLSVNALGVIRSITSIDVSCYGIFCDSSLEIARHTKHLTSTIRLSKNHSDDEILIALSRIRQKEDERRPVVIATADKYAHFISKNQEALQVHYEIRTPTKDIHDAFVDKRKTISICKQHGVLIPSSLSPESFTDIAEIGERLRFPLIVKPSNTFNVQFPGKNFVAKDLSLLKSFFIVHPDLILKTVIQEVVNSGDGRIVVAASYSNRKGNVEAVYTGRKIRQWQPDYGVTCFGVSENIPEIKRISYHFLNDIGYSGFAAMEFAEDKTTGRYYFLELNTRTYYHNQLFSDAGVDLTKVAYYEMCGMDFREYMPELIEKEDIYWIDILRDVLSFAVKWGRGEIGFFEWYTSVRKASSLAVFDPCDLKPFFYDIASVFSKGCKKFKSFIYKLVLMSL